MSSGYLETLYSLDGQVAVITGGTGVIGGVMARGLARAGARVGVLGRRREQAEAVVREITTAGGEAVALSADVLRKEQLEAARDVILERWGRIDILVNAAGGNVPAATVPDSGSFFDLPEEALRSVVDLNLVGTVLPSQVFGAAMVGHGSGRAETGRQGCIVMISSISAQRALTRVMGYGAAKAAVENVTRWLAVELARKHGEGLRVNAIAPGFFITEQNRTLMIEPDGGLTPRARSIVQHTPAGRLGEPEELIGTLIWLCSPGAGWVNGVVIPVDGGFSAFSGV